MHWSASAILILASVFPASAQPDLAKDFQSPPAQARPHTWWHWMNGNITREGITADLEAMRKIGLGGAQIFNVSESIPLGPVKFMSPEWLALVKHAATEADRLGLELCMHNCAGWSSSGGPWITPEHAMQMVVSSEVAVQGPTHFAAALPAPETREGYYRDIAVLAFPTPKDNTARIKDLKVKAGYESRYAQQPMLDAFPAEAVIDRTKVVDLTTKLDGAGRLTWDAPDGAWTVLRLGHTPTGAKNAPAPASGRGLECDKLSREAFDAFWAGSMAKVVQSLGPLAGKTLNNCLVDSYEMGGQNWTPRFREEFTRRRGYDPLFLLPVLTGRVVDSGEMSERFLWDFRRTIADLFADNYYSYFAEKCHASGMLASIEPYDGPFECLQVGRDADIPMGEFWVGGDESPSCKLAASVAHTYGRKIIGAESFTAVPEVGRWLNHPYSLKGVGDLMYTVGINRYIIHRYAHQPWLNQYPGMTMGQWGTHFERTTTWWDQGSGWVQYMARCQYLLQQGRFAADACYFAGDGAPSDGPHRPALKASGYDYDACNLDVLTNRMTVKDGRLALPDGLSYRLLVLPDSPFMTPRTLTRLRELVVEGATIIGPRPTKSPSLNQFPVCDAEVARMASELWGDTDGKSIKEHALGKGRVVWGRTPEEVLAASGTVPDCSFQSASGRLAWIHRVSGDTDVYFVSNQSSRSQEFEALFRIRGKIPELWDADTGMIAAAPLWTESDGKTTVPLRLDPSGSVFVVFRKPSGPSDHFVSATFPAAADSPPSPKVEVTKAFYEAVDGAGSADVTVTVAALVRSGQMSLPANNATYGDPTFNHVKRLRVEFTVDGKPLTKSATENGTLDLVEPGPEIPAACTLAVSPAGGLELRAFRAGAYELRSSGNKTATAEVKSLPRPVEVRGPWMLRFPPNWGAPAEVTLESLSSWTDHADTGVRYFSGTAEYLRDFDIPADLLGSDKILMLDLGSVKYIAAVSLNGQDLGTWWKPPFAADISTVAKPGKNSLRVRITNLWTNRLIGDEQLPADVEWNGKPLKEWPAWLRDGAPRSSGRYTFTTWHHYTRDSQLVESGLIGPVMLRPGQRITIR
jgi:hypothetical protein